MKYGLHASGVLIAALFLAGCSPMSVPPRPTAPPGAVEHAAVHEPTGKGSLPPLLPLTSLDAAIRESVATSPALLPSWLPDRSFDVRLLLDRGYQVQYWRPGAGMWSIEVGCFDGPQPGSGRFDRSFRGGAAGVVRGYDSDDHLSLYWMEPGATGCHDFFVSAYGLSDGDFARLAESLADPVHA